MPHCFSESSDVALQFAIRYKDRVDRSADYADGDLEIALLP